MSLYGDHIVKQVVYDYLETVFYEMGCTRDHLIHETLEVLADMVDTATWEREQEE